MEIITGRTGTPHVYAADDAEIYKLFLGNGDFVLPTGNKLNAQMNGTTQVRIYDGSLITQGRLAKIRPTDGYDTVTLDVGTGGYKRVDLIVAEYNQTVTTTQEEIDGEMVNVTNTIESITLKVVKGTPNANQYVEPAIITGNIDNGDKHQVKLWAVYLDGINFDRLVDYRVHLTTTPIQTLLDTANGQMSQIQAQMTQLQSDIYDYADELAGGVVGAIAGYYKSSTVAAGTNVLTVTMPQAYSYAASDVIEVYLNGLKLKASEYSASGSGSALSIGLTNFTTTAVISELIEDNDIEVIAIKVGGEE